MELFHIKSMGEEKGPYTREQLRSMWDNGAITADTVFRSVNSPDWRSLENEFSPSLAAGEPQPRRSTINPKRKRLLFGGLGVTILVAFVFLGTFHIITGSDIGIKIVPRHGVGFAEIFINVDEITGTSYLFAKTRWPIGCAVLQREGIVESDEALQKRVGSAFPNHSDKPTKAQWKAKFAEKNPLFAQTGTVLQAFKQQFVSLMGEPDRSEVNGNDAYWYYDCSDGIIQVVFNATAGNRTGFLQGQINDY
jgi:hypothetical protein